MKPLLILVLSLLMVGCNIFGPQDGTPISLVTITVTADLPTDSILHIAWSFEPLPHTGSEWYEEAYLTADSLPWSVEELSHSAYIQVWIHERDAECMIAVEGDTIHGVPDPEYPDVWLKASWYE